MIVIQPTSTHTTRARSLRRRLLALLLAVAAGCGRGDRPEEEPAQATSSTAAIEVDTARDAVGPPAEEAEEEERPDTIYYDLTRFEWYRRGQPIVIDETRYTPAEVEATGGRRLKREGAYEGVDYYVNRDSDQPYDTIFVPVYPGYWLPFVSERQRTDGG